MRFLAITALMVSWPAVWAYLYLAHEQAQVREFDPVEGALQ